MPAFHHRVWTIFYVKNEVQVLKLGKKKNIKIVHDKLVIMLIKAKPIQDIPPNSRSRSCD